MGVPLLRGGLLCVCELLPPGAVLQAGAALAELAAGDDAASGSSLSARVASRCGEMHRGKRGRDGEACVSGRQAATCYERRGEARGGAGRG